MEDLKDREDIIWLLDRINFLKTRPGGWKTNRKDIFQGSYDVIFCEQDKIDYDIIMRYRLDSVQSLGLIENDEKENWNWKSIWRLTEAGEKLLKEYEVKSQKNG